MSENSTMLLLHLQWLPRSNNTLLPSLRNSQRSRQPTSFNFINRNLRFLRPPKQATGSGPGVNTIHAKKQRDQDLQRVENNSTIFSWEATDSTTTPILILSSECSQENPCSSRKCHTTLHSSRQYHCTIMARKQANCKGTS